MKLAWTAAVNGEDQVEAEEEVAFLLFEATDLDEEECAELARQIAIVVAKHVAPNLVVEVVD